MGDRLVHRGVGVSVSGCVHGYPTVSDCPRCAVRPSIPVRKVAARTRWHATQTTLGPAAKLTITCVLMLPVLVCLLGLSLAGRYLQNAFLVVPLWAFGIVAAVVLFHVWEPGQPDGTGADFDQLRRNSSGGASPGDGSCGPGIVETMIPRR